MTQKKTPIRVCFVCLGNICRSPTAEGVMTQLVAEAGLTEQFFIDSAGTSAYHTGEAADARSAQAALRRGVKLTSISRQFEARDLETFDYVVAMDRRNLAHLTQLARSDRERGKISLLRAYDTQADGLDVPDPYFEDNFDAVFDICRAGCTGLLQHICAERGLAR